MLVYERQNFLKILVHVIIIDQCNQTGHYSCRCDVMVLLIEGLCVKLYSDIQDIAKQ